MNFKRTYNCGQLTKANIGETVTLAGWIHRRRDHGGLIFIDLRDRFGLTQLVFNPETNPAAHAIAENFRSEFVIVVKGEVIPRAPGMANPGLATGEIEVSIKETEILSKAKNPPFSVCDETINVNEELRLKYRYLDIRRGDVAKKLVSRHHAMQAVRSFLSSQLFIEVATPIMAKSTPEGARDYLVPSRVHPGSFYALPQSPQIFKQLLMISGMDRYFQIAQCFRDEDLRADRQPEFTQIDLEMSFGTPEELFPIIEKLMGHMIHSILGIEIATPFRRETHKWCLDNYGTDKPDLRFGMPLISINDLAKKSSFSVFQDQLAAGGVVKGFMIKGGEDISRKGIDDYTKFISQFGLKGLAWMKVAEDGSLNSSIVKFFDESLQKELLNRFDAKPGDLIFMVADTVSQTNKALDHLRRKVANDRNLIPEGRFEFLWVTDFPLFQWNQEENRLESEHHPFTSPNFDDVHLIDSEPLKVRSSSYDLVLNGFEVGSGSQRIHDGDLQQKIFETLKLSEEDLEQRFGFFIESLKYGTPPHLGIGLGFDRLVMIMTGTDNIRDVIAFPKTQKASDVMMDCPSKVEDKQLTELCLNIDL